MKPRRTVDGRERSGQKELPFMDLHTHTTVSDGLLSPEELVRLAYRLRFAIIGLTDHDSLHGVQRARAEAERYGVRIVSGCELTAYHYNHEMHILGYFLEPDNEGFNQYLERFKQARYERAREIIRRLAKVRVRLSFNALVEKYRSQALGRPHIAREIVGHGYVKDIQEAFDKYLVPGRPAYVPKYHIHPRDVIELILKAGGVPVFAHPYYYFDFEHVIKKLTDYGLRGLEVYHTYHSRAFERKFLETAKRYGLIVTGGSDAHSGPDGTYLAFGKVTLPKRLFKPLWLEHERIRCQRINAGRNEGYGRIKTKGVSLQ